MKTLFALLILSRAAYGISPEILRLSASFKSAVATYSPLNSPKVLRTNVFIIRFVPMTNEHGRCYRNTNPAEIELDSNTWDSISETKREIIFFHELAHCLLGRGHRNTKLNGVAISMMHEKGVPEAQYLANRDYYLEELFFHRDSKEQGEHK